MKSENSLLYASEWGEGKSEQQQAESAAMPRELLLPTYRNFCEGVKVSEIALLFAPRDKLSTRPQHDAVHEEPRYRAVLVVGDIDESRLWRWGSPKDERASSHELTNRRQRKSNRRHLVCMTTSRNFVVLYYARHQTGD